MVTIKVRLNGPYVVDGDDVMLVDWNGAPYQIPKRPFALALSLLLFAFKYAPSLSSRWSALVADTTIASDVEGWDSLAHVNLIVAVEKALRPSA